MRSNRNLKKGIILVVSALALLGVANISNDVQNSTYTKVSARALHRKPIKRSRKFNKRHKINNKTFKYRSKRTYRHHRIKRYSHRHKNIDFIYASPINNGVASTNEQRYYFKTKGTSKYYYQLGKRFGLLAIPESNMTNKSISLDGYATKPKLVFSNSFKKGFVESMNGSDKGDTTGAKEAFTKIRAYYRSKNKMFRHGWLISESTEEPLTSNNIKKYGNNRHFIDGFLANSYPNKDENVNGYFHITNTLRNQQWKDVINNENSI